MIGLNSISHFAGAKPSRQLVFNDLNLRVTPPERVGILARPGSGKTTLARILSGAIQPDFGTRVGNSSLSWPLNYAALLHPDMTPLANVQNLAAAKFLDANTIVGRTESYLSETLESRTIAKNLPPAKKLCVHLAMTLAMPFDCLLADEWPTIPNTYLAERLAARLLNDPVRPGLILLTRHAHLIERYCTRALVLDQGRLIACDYTAQATDILDLCKKRELMDASD